ncbi:hypothetical protein EGI16_13065 [Chryseobacterium sp. G0240]|uniref:hypothetical protein n=1 Tax=Chryseobacterium sp. G0240 TaxID=2487066 RepID=UPI000F450F6B|nr:hypothetical protein [Chryseobacterium sp. G0240]ROI02558.1 hypothetical protein EGI16_13065 [Chryseobacterium sp. G0240]
MEYRDNEVFLASASNNLVKGTFTVNEYSVTSGQDPNGHIHAGYVASCGSDGKFTFSIGRKGSKEVAKWFSDRVPGNRTTFDHNPDDLNFAMIGTLVLEFTGNKVCTFYNIALAQGHSGSSNNWWFGGKQAMNNGGNQVVCGAISNGIVELAEFLRGGNDVSTVKVTPKTF